MSESKEHSITTFENSYNTVKADYFAKKLPVNEIGEKLESTIEILEDCSNFEFLKILELKIYLGFTYYWGGEINKANATVNELENIIVTGKGNNWLKVNMTVLKVSLLFHTSRYKETIELCENLLSEDIKTDVSEEDYLSLTISLAAAYYELGYYHKALLNYYKGTALLHNQPRKYCILSYNIICCLVKQGRFNAAFEELSLSEFKIGNTRDQFVKLFIFLSKTVSNLEFKEFNKSLSYANEGLTIIKKTDRKLMLGIVYQFLCKSYIGLNEYDSAAEYAVLLHSFGSKRNLRNHTAEGLILISKIMLEAPNLPSAFINYEYLNEFDHKLEDLLIYTETLVNEHEIPLEKLAISELLLENFVKEKKYDQAAYYFKIIRKIEANIFNIQKSDLEFHLETEFRQNQHLIDLEHQQQLLKEQKEISNRLESFARTVSHDMKEPLRSIKSFGQLLRRVNKGTLSKDSNEYLDFIIDASHRMNQQIDDLLNYAQLGVNMPETEAVDLNDALIMTKQNLHKQIHETSASIQCESLPIVNAHFSLMVSLFQNLVNNGIKFRKENKDCIINISFKDNTEGFWQFTVTDNGIGMPPNMLEVIFTTFKRLHSYSEYRGSGIGLATCKKTVELYGGEIWATSVENEGSSFHFTIPK